MNKKRKVNGFNLIELMLVLAAIVILSALIFNQYRKYQTSQQAGEVAQNLALAASGIKGFYPRGNFSTISTEVAALGGFFPDLMVDKQNRTIINLINDGVVSVGYATSNDATSITQGTSGVFVSGANYFGIEYADVPSAVCVKLAGAAGGFHSVVINGKQVKNMFQTATRMELNEASVTDACNEQEQVSMLFLTN